MSTVTLPGLARITPPALWRSHRARLLVERNAMVYRHQWMIIVSGLFEPFFYLLSIGIGIGTLVGDLPGPDGQPIDYTAFVAPALFASSAMNGAIYESTFNVYFKLKYAKAYDAILATPLSIADVAVGEILTALIRGALYGVCFLFVMGVMGLLLSPWAVLALPAAILIGFAFAATGMASTTFMRTWHDFEFVQLAILPMFLFSATFYPLSTYPSALQVVVQCTPLYQAVVLLRSLTTGAVGWEIIGHAAYLAVMGVIGVAITSRRLNRTLLP